jgi:uncharacterized protein (TIGR02246 family)
MFTRELRIVLTANLVLALLLLGAVSADDRAEARAAGKQGEEAIRKAVQSYVAAYNKKDVEGLMAHWAEDAEFVDEAGKSVAGRAALTAMFKRTFEGRKDLTLKVTTKSIRLLRPDIAVMDGTATTTAADDARDSSPFTAIWARANGKWLLARVQDLPGEGAADTDSHYQYLKPLEWLVGEWENTDKDNRVTLTCKWTRNRNFLLIEQLIHLKDREVMSVTQVIGWDPRLEQIRSWVFDASGGFGEGIWAREGNRWAVKSEGVTADRGVASATSVWKFIDDKDFEWESIERAIDGVPMPDLRLKYTRKPAAK